MLSLLLLLLCSLMVNTWKIIIMKTSTAPNARAAALGLWTRRQHFGAEAEDAEQDKLKDENNDNNTILEVKQNEEELETNNNNKKKNGPITKEENKEALRAFQQEGRCRQMMATATTAAGGQRRPPTPLATSTRLQQDAVAMEVAAQRAAAVAEQLFQREQEQLHNPRRDIPLNNGLDSMYVAQ